MQRKFGTNIMAKKFDIAEYLDSGEMIKAYLDTVFEEGTSNDIITAPGHVAKAVGTSKIAADTGISFFV
ncbi:MAG: hypothetical protein OEX02_20130 [Cyclobacteriaceae bacterium]|nr:hypothetical protein [Cyclobacteriaceae bacterium]